MNTKKHKKEQKVLKEMIGKTIKTIWKSKAKEKDGTEYDDEPYLYLEMTDGTVFEILSSYDSWTGKSKDEYPCYVTVEKI